ncbi:MAG: hypothetical protein AB9836_12410 [Aminipila sp.]
MSDGIIGALLGTMLGFILQECKSYITMRYNKNAAINEARLFFKREINCNHTLLNKKDSDGKSELEHMQQGMPYHTFNFKGKLKYEEWDRYKFTITEKNSSIAKELTELYDIYIQLESFEGSADKLGQQWAEKYNNAYNAVNKEILK